MEVLKWQIGILITRSIVLGLSFFMEMSRISSIICLPFSIFMNFRPKENIIVWGARIGLLVLNASAGTLFALPSRDLGHITVWALLL